MASCKDCVHVDVCEDITRHKLSPSRAEKILPILRERGKTCELFKNRSRFVELPCKAGDRVYAAFPKAEAVIEYVIVSIWVEEAGVSVRAVDTAFFTYGFFMAHEFGKKLFFTKAEAEQALKERES